MPAYNDPYIPGAHAHLNWMIGMDGILYVREMQTGVTFQLTEAANGVGSVSAGIGEAPIDGATYARQDSQWAQIPQIPTAAGVVITTIQPVSALESTSVPITVNGTGFTPASVVNWGGFPLVTTFINNTTLEATINLGPGSAGIYTVWVTDGNALSNSVAFTVTSAGMHFTSPGVALVVDINPDGDLIITQAKGPNAGKSINLTYGKWT